MVSVECSFTDDSTSACVVVYWQHISNPYNLVNLNSIKLNRRINETLAHGFINLQSPKNGSYHIAIFAFNNDKEMIYGEPLVTFSKVCEQGK